MNFAIALFILAYLIVLLIALYVTSVITKNQNAKIAVFLLWLLFPAWDVFLGYPIYWYLQKYDSGAKIYKKMYHVEGFYVGEKNRNCEPEKPYNGYRYIDYKEKESGKYFRKYWIDTDATKSNLSLQRYLTGKEEISRSAVSAFWLYNDTHNHPYASLLLSLFNLTHQAPLIIKNGQNGQELGELDSYKWEGSWITKMFASSGIESYKAECSSTAKSPNVTFFINSVLQSADASANSSYR